VFAGLMRLGLIPAETCAACANITVRTQHLWQRQPCRRGAHTAGLVTVTEAWDAKFSIGTPLAALTIAPGATVNVTPAGTST